jgi:bacillithiol biosynthesis deacetylase BshB1
MVDILAFAAHPDDAELCISGTLLKARSLGRSIAICDLTQGERGTRGSMDLRYQETERANAVLGLTHETRWNLGMPDGGIETTKESVEAVVRAIRHFRPAVMIFPWEKDRHPDHERAHRLVRQAYFDSGLRHVETHFEGPQEPHRPQRLFTYLQRYERTPDFIVDISDVIDQKLEAIAAYSSQFTVPGRQPEERLGEPATFVSRPEFMEYMIARMRHWGFLIGATYGEGFCTVEGPMKVRDLMDLV